MHTAELGRGWLDAPAVLADLFNAMVRPLGIIAGNDMTALHILAVARARGLSIPEEIGLAGFDDVALASCSDPPLTTVRVDKPEMGRLAARRLVERIASPDLLPIMITMHVGLTIRGSTQLGGLHHATGNETVRVAAPDAQSRPDRLQR
jgi:DNA-binding LacI/PurR family transcriptional regulator